MSIINHSNPVKSIKTTGILLIVLGILGLILPQLISFVIELFLGSMMLLGGIMVAYYTYYNLERSFINWVKPLILIISAVLLLVYPHSGIAALTLLLSFYFFMDAFASFSLSYERHPYPGWFWMTLNGVLSAILAMLLLIGWPETSPLYLGIFVSISLVFDGIALFMLGRAIEFE